MRLTPPASCARIYRATLRSGGFQPPAFAQLGKEGETPSVASFPGAAYAACGNRARFRTFGLRRPVALSVMGGAPMTANDNPQPQHAKRSGSEKRQRASAPFSSAACPTNALPSKRKPASVGLSLASFLRACGLGDARPARASAARPSTPRRWAEPPRR